MMPSDDFRGEAFEDELRSLLDAGRKIEAVKRYREQTGAGLAESKAAVEALERGERLPQREDVSTERYEPELIGLLEQGRKIDAIKLYQQHTGVGLKEAKDAVEALVTERGIVSPRGGAASA